MSEVKEFGCPHCHDDRVVELKEQLGIEEEDGEEQEEEKVKEEGRDRVKENAP